MRRIYISQDQEVRECISNYITLLYVHEIQPSLVFTEVKYAWCSRYHKIIVILMSQSTCIMKLPLTDTSRENYPR